MTQDEDEHDLLQWADPSADHTRWSIDLVGGRDADSCAGLSDAIRWYQQARARLSRRWDELAPTATDQRAALSTITAVMALRERVDSAYRHFILVARQLGVSWADLADVLDEPRESFRADYHRNYVQDYAWPEELQPTIDRLAAADPQS